MHREINRIRAKLGTDPWPKYLESVEIRSLRGWAGQQVRFPFPVTVVVGENGSGKSTVLKAAAAAYKNSLPGESSFAASAFFPDTPWERISGAVLTYETREGAQSRRYSIRKPSRRWRLPDQGRPERAVLWQDVSRTLPIESTVGYSRIAKSTAREISAQDLDDEFNRYYSTILGRPYESSGFATSDADQNRQVGVVTVSGTRYSQFHQGAGEDATLDFVLAVQNIPKTALVVIDEIEASLHPRSQRRLVHFLLWLARNRNIQVIVSTHSHYVIDEVPEEARVFLARGVAGIDVMYGLTANYTLNKMDDIDRPDLFVFCEDRKSLVLISELLRSEGVDLARLKIMDVGPSDAVKNIGRIAAENRLPFAAVAIADADVPPGKGYLVIPGTDAPERQIVADIRESAVGVLAARLELGSPSVADALDQAVSVNDHHQFISQAARLLNQTESYLWSTLCQVWVRHCVDPDAARDLASSVNDALA